MCKRNVRIWTQEKKSNVRNVCCHFDRSSDSCHGKLFKFITYVQCVLSYVLCGCTSRVFYYDDAFLYVCITNVLDELSFIHISL